MDELLYFSWLSAVNVTLINYVPPLLQYIWLIK